MAYDRQVAETKGFEPSRRFPVCTLSRGVPSTTRPHLRSGVYPGRAGSTRRKLRVVIRDVYSSGRQNSHEIPGIWKRRQGLAPIGRNARSGPRGSKRPGHASTHRTPRAIMTVNARAPRKIAWPLRCGIADAMIRRGCQRWSKILPQGGAKAGHFGFGREARHEAAASQPRSPSSWRLTGRLGPLGQDSAGWIRRFRWIFARGFAPDDSFRRSSQGC